MTTDIHSRWKGEDDVEFLRALQKWAKKQKKAVSHYMIQATKEKMIRDGIAP